MQHKRIEIISIVSQALSIYNDSVTEQSAKVWITALERFELDDIKRAFNLYVQTSENGHFAPKPSDIIRLIAGTNTDRAKEAWSVVERAIASHGHNRSMVFSDPLIHRVIFDLGGWVKLCMTRSEKELTFVGLDFEKRYAGYMNRGKLPHYPNRLIGAEERSLREYGLDWRNSLEVVGDRETCRLVYSNGLKPEEMGKLDSNVDIRNMITNELKKVGHNENN